MRELNEDEQGLRNQIDSYQDDLEKIRNNFVYNKIYLTQRELLEYTIEMLNRLGEDLVSEIIHDYE
jgi:hypothetical protein